MSADRAQGRIAAKAREGRAGPSRAGRRWLRRGAVFALCLAVALGLALPAMAQEVGVAARVNGAEISVFRLERHFEDYLKQQARNVVAIRNPEVFKRLKREALDQLIDKELLWQEAQRRGIVVDDAAVREARAGIASGFRTPEAFQRRMQEAGFDDAGYDAYLRRELASSRLLGELIGPVNVSDDAVQRVLAQQSLPAGMSTAAAARQVREQLLAGRRAEASRAALRRLRTDAQIQTLLRF
jgi:peptidyl-prolyl cis-trans isomerase C